ASGQLIIGPLSDRFGRRPLMLAGTFVCILAGVACAVAPNIAALTAFRFVQGFSGAAGVVLSRAVVADRAHGAVAARAFSLMMIINGAAPVLAP
ncbi:MFS transporter, partial [Mycobacterium kansasii]